MPAPYPKTGPVTLTTNLADSPLSAALKDADTLSDSSRRNGAMENVSRLSDDMSC